MTRRGLAERGAPAVADDSEGRSTGLLHQWRTRSRLDVSGGWVIEAVGIVAASSGSMEVLDEC